MKRIFSTLARPYWNTVHGLKDKLKTQSWQIHEYGELDNLQLGSSRIPIIKDPNEVLVKVDAASVNPIDLLMIGGYGRTLFQIPRKCEMELPLTVGRDFSGTIVSKGMNVRDDFKIGDEVYGFVPLHKPGTFSQTILADACHILPKPKHLTPTESASLVYATMTAWSALYVFANMLIRQKEGLRILILGASGGVGTAAVQLLKSQGCVVFATCSEDATPLMSELGADYIFNYNDEDFDRQIESEGRYHIILDAAQVGFQNIPKNWTYDTYITLNSPLLKNTDKYGLVSGLIQSAGTLVESNLSRFRSRGSVRWGFFLPSNSGFNFIHQLISDDKIKPVIHESFTFEKIPEALQMVADGHLRGKVVIDYQNS